MRNLCSYNPVQSWPYIVLAIYRYDAYSYVVSNYAHSCAAKLTKKLPQRKDVVFSFVNEGSRLIKMIFLPASMTSKNQYAGS